MKTSVTEGAITSKMAGFLLGASSNLHGKA